MEESTGHFHLYLFEGQIYSKKNLKLASSSVEWDIGEVVLRPNRT